ncbi:CyaY protein [Crenobacter luteus]|uniref:Iron-sulfur cluster assembly protein CyaY n=1 Tax=Crenobacter luteus TaxID=1452487 RepID=A0A161S6R2_9NEIS|nr:iron donor protein CyaY [Crenobacter luteus]KZE28889.1 iron donor protein CyaY [Crenobacter luteus]TCP11408.1 CyaY protein [Crenobacter luteus]
MNESEFLNLSDEVFERIETALDEAGLDVDCLTNGNVMELEFDSGAKIVVNRHTSNQELWIAARSGGYHFAWRDGAWIAARDGAEFFATLSRAVSEAAGEAFTIAA